MTHSPMRDSSTVSGAVADELKEKAVNRVEKMTNATDDVVSRVAAQGREAGERVQEAAEDLKGAFDRAVRDQPMAALAIAAAMGLVLGALWTRKSPSKTHWGLPGSLDDSLLDAIKRNWRAKN